METQTQPLSPWLTIWVKPRQTIRRIVDSDPQHQVILLAMLGGIFQVLNQSSSRHLGDTLSLPIIFLLCGIAGPIVGIFLLCVEGALLHWIGSRFGGQASPAEVRAACAWSSVPNIWSQILWIPQFALLGKDLFTSEIPKIAANPFLALIFLGFLGVQLVIAVWAFVVLLICLGEVHRFSIWKALATTLINGL
ncbi:MAG: Yip1 family protein, partial [Chloroflexota bacterium]|nr:Yip1 family protein [Chloroflexota bacterium]